jgi:hypothetical protein
VVTSSACWTPSAWNVPPWSATTGERRSPGTRRRCDPTGCAEWPGSACRRVRAGPSRRSS